jgi:hypothetical protein
MVLPGLDQRGLHLGAGVRLEVGEVGAEQFLNTINRELLCHVDMLAAAIVTLAGISLDVLVGEHGALGLHHLGAGVVLRRDQLDALLLAAALRFDRRPEPWVGLGDLHLRIGHPATPDWGYARDAPVCASRSSDD